MIYIKQMVEVLHMFNDYYDSVAMFADDLYEVLYFAGRISDDKAKMLWWGTFEIDNYIFIRKADSSFRVINKSNRHIYSLFICNNGVVRLVRRERNNPDPRELEKKAPIFAVEEAEELKKQCVEKVFAVLKQQKEMLNCFVLEYDKYNSKWISYSDGLVPWLKEKLYP